MNQNKLKEKFFKKFGEQSFRGYPLEQCHAIWDFFNREIIRMKSKESQLKLIEEYKEVLRMAKVPKLIIENPKFIKSMPITKDDIEWAKQKIKEIQSQSK